MSQTQVNGLETIFMSDIETMNEAKLVNGMVGHLKPFKLYSKQDKDTFCSMLWGICGDNLFNDDFMNWLAYKLNKRKEMTDQTRTEMAFCDHRMPGDTWKESTLTGEKASYL